MLSAYFIWAGLWLVVVPWTALWDRNVLVAWWPTVGLLLHSPFVRGAVSGVGLVTVVGGLRELAAFLVQPTRDESAPPGNGSS